MSLRNAVSFPILGFRIYLDLDLLGDRTADFSTITNFAAKPLALKLVFLAFALTVGGPLAEELGWRGYALERLANSSNARVGSLLLGSIWSFWHLPLFLMKGSWHEDFLGWSGWLSFMVWIVSSSVVMTYIYYSNRRSILSAILLHFSMNLTLCLLTPYSREAFHFSTVLLMVLAVHIIRRV